MPFELKMDWSWAVANPGMVILMIVVVGALVRWHSRKNEP